MLSQAVKIEATPKALSKNIDLTFFISGFLKVCLSGAPNAKHRQPGKRCFYQKIFLRNKDMLFIIKLIEIYFPRK
jgi:hypothetical protein